MTTATTPALGAGLTPGDREKVRAATAEWLRSEWAHLGAERWQVLDTCIHPSLTGAQVMERRDGLTEWDASERALRGGVADWRDVFPDLKCPGDYHETAIELAGERVREALYGLLNGETER